MTKFYKLKKHLFLAILDPLLGKYEFFQTIELIIGLTSCTKKPKQNRKNGYWGKPHTDGQTNRQ